MATSLSSPLSDPGGCLICQRLALAVVLVDLGNTSKEIIRCSQLQTRFAGSHRSLQPNTARLPVQSVPVTIRQRHVFHDEAIRAHDDLPFPSDVAGTERYLEIVSRRLVHAIANHEFTNARYYDQQDRKARALLAKLRAMPS